MRFILITMLMLSLCYSYNIGNKNYKMSGSVSYGEKNSAEKDNAKKETISISEKEYSKNRIDIYISMDNPKKDKLVQAIFNNGFDQKDVNIFYVVTPKNNK